MTRLRDRPSFILTRHFFARLFEFELLADAGRGSIVAPLAGTTGVLIGLGLLLARVLNLRYRLLHKRGDIDLFEQAVLTDHVFLLAAVMWIVAFIAVLIGPSLFPDETDFRVLTPLPLPRRLVFGAKLAALGLVAGIFFAIAEVSLFPMYLLTASSPWPDVPMLAQTAAYLTAGALGALFSGLAVTAVHAVLLLAVPRARLLPVSAAVGSLLLFALVMALPLIGHVPSFKPAFDSNAAWLYWFPPAWFVGVEHWLLGDGRFVVLAASALAALLIVGAIAATAYVVLYRHFARVMARPAADQGARLPAASMPVRRLLTRRPAFAAVRAFVAATLRRSVLHQGIFVTLSAIGAALVTNSLLNVSFSPRSGYARRQLEDAVMWAPFALTFIVSFSIRAALLVPIEGRANWVFRMTELPRQRADQIDAAVATVRRLGVVLPCLLLLPVQWLAMGPNALVTTGMAILSGYALVEILLHDWRRVPFTCSFILGKGFVPQILLLGFLAFVGFTTVGSALAHVSVAGPPVFGITAAAVLLGLIATMARIRRRSRAHVPLEFEDSLPTETNPLRLSTD